MYATIGTYYSFQMTVSCPGWIVSIQPGQQTVVVYTRLYILMMDLDTPETCRG